MTTDPTRPISDEMPSKSPAFIQVEDLIFAYPEAPAPILNGVNVTLRKGELVILAGPSGCGKSSLCRHLNGVIPNLSSGEDRQGKVLVNGLDAREVPVHVLATHVGMVFQNPESQICCLQVEDELAFGPENLGLSHQEIVSRVEQVVKWLSLDSIRRRFTFELSGGQKQRIAIASSLALLPDLLVLDEPTTDLDPVGSAEIVSTLRSLRDTLGLTLLVVEHDLDELIEIADRLIVMNHGQVLLDGTPRDLFNQHYDDLERVGLRIPQHIVMAHALARDDSQTRFAIGRQEAIAAFTGWASRLTRPVDIRGDVVQGVRLRPPDTAPAVKLDGVTFSYDGQKNAVDGVNLAVFPSEFVAVVGANGSGKSTLARLIIGLLQPQAGEVSIIGMSTKTTPLDTICKKVGYLFQNPDAQLFSHTVESEIAFGMRVKKMPEELIREKTKQVLEILGLEGYEGRHPFALSRGERQRLAMATVLVTDPDIIILDEPTTGQDRRTLDGLISLMHDWIQRKHATVLMICHDMDLVCKHATRVVVLRDGRVVCDGAPSEVFLQSYDTLAAMRLLPPTLIEASRPWVGSKLSRVFLSIEEFKEAVCSAVAESSMAKV